MASCSRVFIWTAKVAFPENIMAGHGPAGLDAEIWPGAVADPAPGKPQTEQRPPTVTRRDEIVGLHGVMILPDAGGHTCFKRGRKERPCLDGSLCWVADRGAICRTIDCLICEVGYDEPHAQAVDPLRPPAREYIFCRACRPRCTGR